MDYSIHAISIAAIDETNQQFRISTNGHCTDLLESIEVLGVIHPPFLWETAADGLVIVSGRRRIEASRKLGHQQITARIIPAEVTIFDCVKLAVADNSLQRPLNIIEQSRAYRMLTPHVIDAEERRHLFRLLDLPHHPAMVAKIERVCSFPSPLQSFLLDGSIQLPVALLLAEMPQESALFLAQLFDDLKIGLNKQREILLTASEIAIREDIALLEIFNQAPLSDVLASPDLDRPRKTQKIRDGLRKRRFPNIAAAEEKFTKCVQELPLQDTISLTAPRHFEGTTYSVTMEFSNMDELKDRYERLGSLVGHPALEKVICSGNG